MTIRTAYPTFGNDPIARLNRKIDQAYEMAGLARQDRDHEDEKRWFKEVERLKEELRLYRS